MTWLTEMMKIFENVNEIHAISFLNGFHVINDALAVMNRLEKKPIQNSYCCTNDKIHQRKTKEQFHMIALLNENIFRVFGESLTKRRARRNKTNNNNKNTQKS